MRLKLVSKKQHLVGETKKLLFLLKVQEHKNTLNNFLKRMAIQEKFVFLMVQTPDLKPHRFIMIGKKKINIQDV